MSVRILWKLPVPSTALLGTGPVLAKRLGRELALRFEYESDDNHMLEAYDTLVDRGATDWLSSVPAELNRNGHDSSTINHLMILFDDGPCYEAICRSFRIDADDANGTVIAARATMRDLAARMLSGMVDLLEGTPAMAGLVGRLPADESSSTHLAIFIAVDSELDAIPMSAVRSKRAPAALAEKDRQRAEYLARIRKQLEEACRAVRRVNS